MNLDDVDLLADTWGESVPHEQLDLLREHDPVHWHPEPEGPGFWAVTRHEDVVAISRDTETFSSELGSTFISTQTDEAMAQMRLSILNMDGAKHNRYRRLVSKGFTPRVVAQLEEQIVERAEAIVDAVCERGECEFVEEVAAQLPLQIICDMIGLPEADWPRMFQLSNTMVGFDDPELQATPEVGAEAAAEIYAYCDAIANDRRANPRDDLMTALVQAEIDGDRLDDLELNLFFVTLVVAGNETTRNLITHGTLALIEHPDQAKRLRAEPELLPTAVEEMLRWGTSIHNFRRTATRDVELRGARSRKATRSSCTTWGPTATPTCSTSPTPSTSPAPPTTTWPSVGVVRTSASVPTWPGPRSERPSARWSSACPTSSWPVRSTGSAATSSTASSRCRSASRRRPVVVPSDPRSSPCTPTSAIASASSSPSSPSPTAATSSWP